MFTTVEACASTATVTDITYYQTFLTDSTNRTTGSSIVTSLTTTAAGCSVTATTAYERYYATCTSGDAQGACIAAWPVEDALIQENDTASVSAMTADIDAYVASLNNSLSPMTDVSDIPTNPTFLGFNASEASPATNFSAATTMSTMTKSNSTSAPSSANPTTTAGPVKSAAPSSTSACDSTSTNGTEASSAAAPTSSADKPASQTYSASSTMPWPPPPTTTAPPPSSKSTAPPLACTLLIEENPTDPTNADHACNCNDGSHPDPITVDPYAQWDAFSCPSQVATSVIGPGL